MRGAQGRGHTFRRICSLRCEPSRSSRKNLGSVEGIGSWLMTAARAAVVGGAASRALGEGMNALPEARAIAKMIIRIAALAAWWPSEEWRVSGTAGALSRNTSTGVRAEHFTLFLSVRDLSRLSSVSLVPYVFRRSQPASPRVRHAWDARLEHGQGSAATGASSALTR